MEQLSILSAKFEYFHLLLLRMTVRLASLPDKTSNSTKVKKRIELKFEAHPKCSLRFKIFQEC